MPHLHPFLRLIYLFLRVLAWLTGHLFYRQRLVLGRSHLQGFHGPAIVVVNHPSTLMDVLNVGVPIPTEMFFLANYGLFKHPVSNWILSRLFCIPIKRKEDVRAGETRDNNSAFEQSFRHLEKEGILYIAPEGYSWMNRWVREFKTGTARIAFGSESRNNWQLGLSIYPVGLTYSAPNLFRSEVVINYGEPLVVSEWSTVWQQNGEAAIDQLTAELQQRVTALTVHTRDEVGEAFTARLEEMLANEHPLSPTATFQRSQKLANEQIDNEVLRLQITEYYAALQATHLSDQGVQKATQHQGGTTMLAAFFLTLGFPLFVVGYAFWWLPLFLPWLLPKTLKLYVGYDSTLKTVTGLITIPLWLWAVYSVVHHFSGNSGLAWLVLIGFVALAFFIERYMDVFQRFREKMKALAFAQQQPAEWSDLVAKRRQILNGLGFNKLINHNVSNIN